MVFTYLLLEQTGTIYMKSLSYIGPVRGPLHSGLIPNDTFIKVLILGYYLVTCWFLRARQAYKLPGSSSRTYSVISSQPVPIIKELVNSNMYLYYFQVFFEIIFKLGQNSFHTHKWVGFSFVENYNS